MVKELAIARGFGKQVRIGAEPCQYDSDDVSSGSEDEAKAANEGGHSPRDDEGVAGVGEHCGGGDEMMDQPDEEMKVDIDEVAVDMCAQ
jgi:hypothetical protein